MEEKEDWQVRMEYRRMKDWQMRIGDLSAGGRWRMKVGGGGGLADEDGR